MDKGVDSSDAREAIFGSIRQHLDHSKAKDPAPDNSITVPLSSTADLSSSENLTGEFKQNVEYVGAFCHIGSVGSAASYLQELVDTDRIKTAALSDSPLVASVTAAIQGASSRRMCPGISFFTSRQALPRLNGASRRRER